MIFLLRLFNADKPNLAVDDVFRLVFMVERCSCLNGGEFRLQTSSCYGIMRNSRKGVRLTVAKPAEKKL